MCPNEDESRATGALRHDCARKLQQLLGDERCSGAVLMFHLENLNLITETFGNAYVKKLLDMIAEECERLTESRAYRYIGGRFVLILDGCSEERAQQVTDEITEHFFNAWRVGGVDCVCNMYGGITFFPGHTQEPMQLLSHLAAAVEESRHTGVNRFVLYDSALKEKLSYKQRLAHALENALEDDLLEMRYRATYHITQQRYVRAECRLRLNVPDLGLVDAADFMPIAERTGQACAFGYHALERVCALIRRLLRAGREFEGIAVPVSPLMFFQEDFPDLLGSIMARFNIPRHMLGIEFSENTLLRNYPSIDTVISELQDLGVELILGDYGTGSSGVDSVLRLPVDVLKISRSLIWQLESEPRACELVRGLLAMGQHLNIKMIAAGVETENQYQLLEEYGCLYEQGFYYTPTTDAAGLEKLFPAKEKK